MVTLEKMVLRRIVSIAGMWIIGTIVWKSYDRRTRLNDCFTIVCRAAETIVGTRLNSYDGRATSYDVVRCRMAMAQHREKAVHVITCEHMIWIATTWHGVQRCRTTSRDKRTIPYNLGNPSKFVIMTQNHLKVIRGSPMAATSHSVSVIRKIHHTTVHNHQNFSSAGGHTTSLIRLVWPHSLRYLKLNAQPSYNGVRPSHKTLW